MRSLIICLTSSFKSFVWLSISVYDSCLISIYLHSLSRQEKNGSFNSQNVFCYTAIFSVRFPTRRRLCICVWSRRWTNFVWTFPSSVGWHGRQRRSQLDLAIPSQRILLSKIYIWRRRNKRNFCFSISMGLRTIPACFARLTASRRSLIGELIFCQFVNTWLPQQYLVNRSE